MVVTITKIVELSEVNETAPRLYEQINDKQIDQSVRSGDGRGTSFISLKPKF